MNTLPPAPVRLRMPPSPTGALHLGTARTALFNWIYARSHKGEIIFRCEDTDLERSKSEFEVQILEGLAWLGMDFVHDADGFFRQTENAPLHQEHLMRLWEEEKVFPCFVTPEEIEQMRNTAAKEKRNFVFWSPYRDTPRTEAEKKMQESPFVWRLRVEKDRTVTFHDEVRGTIETRTDTLGDFVVARGDGSVLYLLANVIDDALQGITHIIRGEDHISNTPKQILIFEALGWGLPVYAHIPLVLDSAKRKLSKRNTDPEVCVLIPDFQKAGFVPQAVVNGLALTGWNPKTTQELFSLQELIDIFDIKGVHAGGAQYDFQKMRWLNREWMNRISVQELLERMQQWAAFSGTDMATYAAHPGYKKAVELLREKAHTLAEIHADLEYILTDTGLDTSLLLNEKMKVTPENLPESLAFTRKIVESIPESDFTAENLKNIFMERIPQEGFTNGQVLWPARVALTNRAKSAGFFEVAEIIGKAETLRRLGRV